MPSMLKKPWIISAYLLHCLFHDDLINRAGALAYTTVLAIVPFMLAIVTVLSYFPIFDGVGNQIQQLIVANFVAESAHTLSVHLTQFLHNVRHLSKTNLYLLIVLDVLMLYNIHEAFNAIWRVKPRWHLSLSFLIYIAVLMLSPCLLGGILVIGGALYKLPIIKSLLLIPSFNKPLLLLSPYLVNLITFTVINWVLPSCRVRFRYALVGGLVTTLLFELSKNLFAFYLEHFHTYRELYGALATFPVFLIWLYVSWLIILVGALLTHLTAVGLPPAWQQKCKQ